MQLQLKYSNTSGNNTDAFFILSEEPLLWLQQINSLQLKPDTLRCFVVPKSINNIAPCGLFVIPAQKINLPLSGYAYAYYKYAGSIYLPHQAVLFPPAGSEEIKSLMLYPVTVFHPSVGLLGFEENDEIKLNSLIEFGNPTESSWWDAVNIDDPLPPLFNVTVRSASANDFLNQIKDEISTKPIEDLNPNKNKSELDKLKDTGKLTLLKGLRGITNALETGMGFIVSITGALGGLGLESSASQAAQYSGGSDNYKPDAYQRFKNWMNQNIEDLEKKRADELQRLLNMFDENSDEALQYAIPLDSNYFSRGESVKTWQLGRRNTDFSLRNIGGGQNVDSWDIGNYYHDLRKKYLAKAQKEMDAGNFKKAAYVYAHLLNDFNMAADALKRGKMYREAAAIYTEQLKNKHLAAECLESGGLYNEAIDLYIELNKHEKAGDLYTIMEQGTKANTHYTICVDNALKNNDYLEAARIEETKKKEPETAINTLLEGWSHSEQKETCLTRYFEKIETSEAQKLSDKLQYVYAHKISVKNKDLFLNVISQLVLKTKDKDAKEISTGMAYNVISEQLAKGNHTGLTLLRNFLPDDELVVEDVYRYLSKKPVAVKKIESTKSINLKEEINWLKLFAIRNEFFALGEKNDSFDLVRGNWEGRLEYKTLDQKLARLPEFKQVSDTFFTHKFYFFEKGFPINGSLLFEPNQHYLNHFILEFQSWRPANTIASVISGQQRISFICTAQKGLSIHHYNFNGQQISGTMLSSGDKRIEELILPDKEYQLVFRRGLFYLATNTMIIRTDEIGTASIIINQEQIKFIAVTEHHTMFRLVLHTAKGCVIYRFNGLIPIKTSDYFAQDLQPHIFKLLPDDKLIICCGNKVWVYSIVHDVSELITVIESEEAIYDIVSAKRNSIAVLDAIGKITIYNLDLI